MSLNGRTINDTTILGKMLAVILCIKFNTFMFAAMAHALRQTDKVKGIKAIIHNESTVELSQTSYRG
jgi:hypothetical protein